ncbi:MAG: hypothetical protein ACI9FN_001399 [Saprospiraceae bacterium]|jgi:hypothetical protein
MKINSSFFFALILFFGNPLSAQEVTVSSDMSLRAKLAYDIIGRVDESILLYQNELKEQSIIIYNNELVQQSERQINLFGKRPEIYEVVNLDTAFAVIYGFHEKKTENIQMDIFSATAELIDSISIASKDKEWSGLNFETIMSQDERVIAFYDMKGKGEMQLLIYDLDLDSVLHNNIFLFNGSNLNNDLLNVDLSNNGDFYMLTEINNNKSQKDQHEAIVFHFFPFSEEIQQINIPLYGVVCGDLMLSVDNNNGQIGIVGLYNEKKYSESTGFLWIAAHPMRFDNLDVKYIPFSQDLYFEVYGNRNEKHLDDFAVAEVIWKNNGSPILTFEMQVDISRRAAGRYITNQSSSSRNYQGNNTGWSDHYREDVVIISLSNKAEVDWHKVFYKRQFSQNDEGVFSSFYSFLTPSRLRLIYNDEIKSNNTVSEYVLDPLGNYKRTSVLSTEYQNLKLRFQDATQISSTELLVPSQKNYDLSLVKIDFSK